VSGAPLVSRIDPQVDFVWGDNSPAPGVINSDFSARWTGKVQARSSEDYVFWVVADDGIRLWIDGQLLVDDWDAPTLDWHNTDPLALTAGQKYDIKIEMFDNYGGGRAQLYWRTTSSVIPLGPVPMEQLYLPPAGLPPTITPTVTPSPTSTPRDTPEGGSRNVALNKPATATGECNVGENPAQAVDGEYATKLCDNSDNPVKQLQVDLEAVYNIYQFVIYHAGSGGESPDFDTRDFNIQVSTNGVDWTTVVEVVGNSTDVTTYNIADADARYIRLNIITPSQLPYDNTARIYEFEAYGTGGPTATPTLTATATITSTPTLVTGTGVGLAGEYFNNLTVSGPPSVSRIDPQVDFAWGDGSPAPGVINTDFSARWTGQVQARSSEAYVFSVFADDGVRLWINGQLKVNDWSNPTLSWHDTSPITLTAGQKYDVKIEMFDNYGGADMHFYWHTVSGTVPFEPVPMAQLYLPAGGLPATVTPTITLSPTITLTPTITSTATQTPTITQTPTVTSTATVTSTVTATRTATPTQGVPTAPVTINYTYDALHRLTAADYSDGRFYHYTYDAVGNRQSQQSQYSNTAYIYDDANRLISVDGVPFTWDNNGNLLSDGQNTYTYNSANRLTGVSGPSGTITYAYNGLGERLQQTAGGVTTTYLVDLEGGLSQVLSDGTNSYLYGNGRILQANAGETQYFLGDALGSVRQLADAGGVVSLAKGYDPFGNASWSAGTAQTPFGYTSEQTDANGLVYLRARYYAPVVGRFQSKDRWRGEVYKPSSLNLWNYVEGNPINKIDPSGFISETDSDQADFIADQLQLDYGITIMKDWGYKPIYSIIPDLNGVVLGCNWSEGNWRNLAELKLTKDAINDLSIALKGNENLKSAIGNVRINRQPYVFGVPAFSPPGLLSIIGNIVIEDYLFDNANSYNGAFGKFSIVHELGHVWDYKTNNKLSHNMMVALGTWVCPEGVNENLPERQCWFPYKHTNSNGQVVSAEPAPDTTRYCDEKPNDPNCLKNPPYSSKYGYLLGAPFFTQPGAEDWAQTLAYFVYTKYQSETTIGLGSTRRQYVQDQIDNLP
jgi:RHS repeat-associated protein